jgi:hypothetical protein
LIIFTIFLDHQDPGPDYQHYIAAELCDNILKLLFYIFAEEFNSVYTVLATNYVDFMINSGTPSALDGGGKNLILSIL